MLVNLPTKGYEDTGEGGLAFCLLVGERESGIQRCACIVNGMFWENPDVCISPCKFDKTMRLDAGLLIGSTGKSLWNKKTGEYFRAKVSDLTEEGKALYKN